MSNYGIGRSESLSGKYRRKGTESSRRVEPNHDDWQVITARRLAPVAFDHPSVSSHQSLRSASGGRRRLAGPPATIERRGHSDQLQINKQRLRAAAKQRERYRATYQVESNNPPQSSLATCCTFDRWRRQKFVRPLYALAHFAARLVQSTMAPRRHMPDA